jgi:abhydrolase domain-containing protein 17
MSEKKQNKIRLFLFGGFSCKRAFKLIVIIAGTIVVLAICFSNKLIFPGRSTYKDLEGTRKIVMRDGTLLTAMYLPNPKAEYTVLYCHGNYEDLAEIRPDLMQYKNQEFSVFAYDYRGYGASGGKTNEKNAYSDVEAIYEYLTKEQSIPPEKIIIFGRSVGSGVAIHLASTKPAAGLILESAFVSANRVVTRWPILPWDKFDNLAKIKKVHCPVLIIHGEADPLIKIWHGKKLYESANEPKLYLWVAGAEHNNTLFVARELYWKKVNELLELIKLQNLEKEKTGG